MYGAHLRIVNTKGKAEKKICILLYSIAGHKSQLITAHIWWVSLHIFTTVQCTKSIM